METGGVAYEEEEKEFYKLAALWCKTTGKKTFTSSKKVSNKELTPDQYNALLKKMVDKTKVGNAAYKAAPVSSWGSKNVPRDLAISQFYRAYQVATKDYLISGLKFAPKSDSSTQKFVIYYN